MFFGNGILQKSECSHTGSHDPDSPDAADNKFLVPSQYIIDHNECNARLEKLAIKTGPTFFANKIFFSFVW